MGADALSSIKTWHNTENLFSMAHFVGCTRPGHPIDKTDLPEEGDFTLIDLPALEISSTACRDRVRAGRPIRYLVPDGVIQYISKRGLYRD
jgi:nicotinate-nucleotide adenylyltransferase